MTLTHPVGLTAAKWADPVAGLTRVDRHVIYSTASPFAETDVILRDEWLASSRLDLLHGP
jgi:hypothetical protein